MDKEFAYSFKEYVTTGNAWCDMNPISKLTIAMCVGLSTIFVRDWRYGFAWCIFCIVFSAFVGIFRKFIKQYFAVSIMVIILTYLLRQITAHGDLTYMFSLFGWKWYLEPFIESSTIISYIMGFTACLLIYFNTTEMRDLMYSLEQKGMTHMASFIMLSSMQSIIDMKKSAEIILESQKSRGIETDGNVVVRMKAFFPTLGPILLSAMSGTEEKAIAMDARAFSVETKHTYLRELKPVKTGEKLLVAFFVLLFAASVAHAVLRGIMKF